MVAGMTAVPGALGGRPLRISLVTLGDPAKMTGGYLFHRRVAALAPEAGAAVRFVAVPSGRFPRPALAGAGALRAAEGQRPDVLLLDSIAAAALALWLGRARVPVAAIVHQSPGGIDGRGWARALQAAADRWAYRRVARLLVASAALARELRLAGLPADRLVVIEPGRDAGAGLPGTGPPGAGLPDAPPRPTAARTAELRAGRAVAVLCVANWLPRKGVDLLLAAVARLPPGDLTLHLVGDAAADRRYAAAVRRRLAGPDLAGRVVVHGVLAPADVAGMYVAADVFALPSLVEPYGTAYGEAMAAGLPVVGWAAGNLPHLARDGVEGLVLAPGDVAALATGLHRLATDAGTARPGWAARRRRRDVRGRPGHRPAPARRRRRPAPPARRRRPSPGRHPADLGADHPAAGRRTSGAGRRRSAAGQRSGVAAVLLGRLVHPHRQNRAGHRPEPAGELASQPAVQPAGERLHGDRATSAGAGADRGV